MELIPLYDKVLVKRDAAETVSAGGIVLPGDEKTKKPERGRVITVGNGFRAPDGRLIPLTVQPGDLVYFSKYAGQEITVLGETFLVILESEIQAIFKP